MENPLKILVAEDELGDVLLLQRAFAKAGVEQPVYFAADGQEVISYLSGKPPFTDPVKFPLPNLLLLDLKLPQVDGFEVLQWIRQEPAVRHLLVVVFTACERPEDIQRAYELGANSYEIKPQDPRELINLVGRLQRFWLDFNPLPENAPALPHPAAA